MGRPPKYVQKHHKSFETLVLKSICFKTLCFEKLFITVIYIQFLSPFRSNHMISLFLREVFQDLDKWALFSVLCWTQALEWKLCKAWVFYSLWNPLFLTFSEEGTKFTPQIQIHAKTHIRKFEILHFLYNTNRFTIIRRKVYETKF